MMFFVSCSDDDKGGTGGGNGDKDAYSVTILTQPYSGLTSTTVEVSGTCTITGIVPEVYAYGFVYGTSKSPEAGNEGVVKVQVGMSETGDFKTTLEGLTPNTTYYYRAYFEKDGAYEYGNTKTFTMKPADDGIDVPTAGELVDMGGRVKWASCNWDASSPEQTGVLCGWGDPTGTVKYQGIIDTYDFYVPAPGCYEYYAGVNPPKEISGTELDIAYVKSQGRLRMPTRKEMDDLVEDCLVKTVLYNNVEGLLFIAPNGNKLFFPSCGRRIGSEVLTNGLSVYWTGTFEQYSYGNLLVYGLGFQGGEPGPTDGMDCCLGGAIRPVADK